MEILFYQDNITEMMSLLARLWFLFLISGMRLQTDIKFEILSMKSWTNAASFCETVTILKSGFNKILPL